MCEDPKAHKSIMNAADNFKWPMQFSSIDEERLHRKQRLTAALRLFGKFGFDEGAAGHITVRDPEQKNCFWVNPMGVSFKQVKMSSSATRCCTVLQTALYMQQV